jgi:hypothetical protein
VRKISSDTHFKTKNALTGAKILKNCYFSVFSEAFFDQIFAITPQAYYSKLSRSKFFKCSCFNIESHPRENKVSKSAINDKLGV